MLANRWGARFTSLDSGLILQVNGTDVWAAPKNDCTTAMKGVDTINIVFKLDKAGYTTTLASQSKPGSAAATPNAKPANSIYDVAPGAVAGASQERAPVAPPASAQPPSATGMHVGDPLWLHTSNPSRDEVVAKLKEGGMEDGLFLIRQKYGNFDVISDHFSRIPQLYTMPPHAV